jgi:Nucleotidyl transferase AbiEii toxin, Type IV TA system/Phage integrase family
MNNFAKLAADERRAYVEETANRRNSTNTAIEKDFWVCWTLRHLFSLQGVPQMCFKGGTSLSKVFGLIHRFSEDISIQFTAPANELKVANRELGTIESIGEDGRLRLNMDGGRAVELDPRQHPHLDHGYAMTRQVSPHVLRHTCAMIVLQATKDIRKVSLWLGHSDLTTTEVYVRADPTEKLEAIEAPGGDQTIHFF